MRWKSERRWIFGKSPTSAEMSPERQSCRKINLLPVIRALARKLTAQVKLIIIGIFNGVQSIVPPWNFRLNSFWARRATAQVVQVLNPFNLQFQKINS